jgi:hypothetical protein
MEAQRSPICSPRAVDDAQKQRVPPSDGTPASHLLRFIGSIRLGVPEDTS